MEKVRSLSTSTRLWIARLTLRRTVLALVLPLTVLLLVGHAFKWDRIRVDGSTLALLGILMILPYVHLIRKLRVREVEAEIAPEEVGHIRERFGPELPPAPARTQEMEAEEPSIMSSVRQDPPIGLVKLRIELEQAMRSLLKSVRSLNNLNSLNKRRFYSLSQLTAQLDEQGVLPREVVGTLHELIPLLNRAAHGQYIRTDDAVELALLGIRVLEEIRSLPRRTYN